MFPSSSNNSDHFPFTNQAMVTEKENPSSSQQHHQQPPSLFLHFPADQPFLDDDNELFMSHFFSQQQFLGYSSYNVAAETEIKMASPVKATKKTTTKKKKNGGINSEKQAVPQKRTGKKDRHSKIHTAQGPRDRRMRLSLQIARKFFDLQDMLGFDKASKTIEWLFSKSKAAIKELTESLPTCTGGAKSLSSSSESEVVSGIKNFEDTGDHKSAPVVAEPLVGLPRGAMARVSRKSIINPIIRVSRDKARARARERTIEKMKMRGLEKSRMCSEEANPNNDLEHLGSSSSTLQTAEKNCSVKVVADQEEEESGMVHLPEHEMDSMSIIEKFLGITTSPTSSSIFDYTHNIGESSGSSSQKKHPVYTQYNSYCALTNMKGSTGHLQAQNFGQIFNINPDSQEQESASSIYMSTRVNAHEQNPSSDFNKALSNAHVQNPSSIFMSSQPHFLEDQFSCNPIVNNKYCSFY